MRFLCLQVMGFILAALMLCTLGAGAEIAPATDTVLEKEIAGLDEAIKISLAKETGRQLLKKEKQGHHAFLEEKYFNEEFLPEGDNYIEPDFIEPHSVGLAEQPQGHLLITTGDVVYFPLPRDVTLRPDERYFIYQKSKLSSLTAQGEKRWYYRRVGKLRIVEVKSDFTVAYILVANDIIHPGDRVVIAAPDTSKY